MTQPAPQPDPSGTVSEMFLGVIRAARRNPDRAPIEDTEFVAMMWRMARATEARTIENPEMLTQVIALAQRFAEIVNVAIAANAERYQIDPRRGASMMECARLLGISKQSASERKARGVAVMGERIDAAGAARFSEAKRERQAIEAAAEHAVTNLADYRARHQAA